MNTKFFFLLLIFLLIATTTSSVVNNKQKESAPIEAGTSSETKTSGKEHTSTERVPWIMDWSTTHNIDHHPDDDGKCHRFHFSRLSVIKRRRFFYLCLSKIILAIIHLSCFLYGFAHLLH
jgi:hypothetical protein